MTETDPGKDHTGPSSLLLTVFAFATGALVANLYYAQPLAHTIATALGIKPALAGSLVSVTQIGYGIGLFFLVSISDLVENKRLVIGAIGAVALALAVAATATRTPEYFAASLVIGIGSTGAQVLVPFVAHLVPVERRGRVIGQVMSGLLTGIMLARPAALFVSGGFGWRAVFWCSAVLMIATGALLARLMPSHRPAPGLHYGQILGSMIGLLRRSPLLRRRAVYQGLMFAAFNMFWTAVPVMLADRFGLSQQQIALFALAGAGGALAAPLAGRLGDRGLFRETTATAMAIAGASFLASAWVSGWFGLLALVVFAVLLDGAVQTGQVISQRLIFTLAPDMRGRVNGIYMTLLFCGGAFGSFAGIYAYHLGGWPATAGLGGLLGMAMLAYFATEPRGLNANATGQPAPQPR